MIWRCEFKMIAFLWESRKQHLRFFYTRAIPLQHQSAVATAVAIAGSSNNGIRTEIKHYMVGQWHVKVDCVSGFSWKTSSHSEGSNQTVEMIHCMPVGGFQPKVLWSWVFIHRIKPIISLQQTKLKYVQTKWSMFERTSQSHWTVLFSSFSCLLLRYGDCLSMFLCIQYIGDYDNL